MHIPRTSDGKPSQFFLDIPRSYQFIFLIPHPLAASRHPGESRDPEI